MVRVVKEPKFVAEWETPEDWDPPATYRLVQYDEEQGDLWVDGAEWAITELGVDALGHGYWKVALTSVTICDYGGKILGDVAGRAIDSFFHALMSGKLNIDIRCFPGIEERLRRKSGGE